MLLSVVEVYNSVDLALSGSVFGLCVLNRKYPGFFARRVWGEGGWYRFRFGGGVRWDRGGLDGGLGETRSAGYRWWLLRSAFAVVSGR